MDQNSVPQDPGEYTLVITSFEGYRKAEQPLLIKGNRTLHFTR